MIPASPFYGTIFPPRMECPQCRRLILFGRGQPHATYANPITQTVQCPWCKRSWSVGLIVSPAPRTGGQSMAGRVPSDAVPNLRQLAELRTYLPAFLLEEVRKGADPVNRYLDGECCCWPLPWRQECPIHGGLRLGQGGGRSGRGEAGSEPDGVSEAAGEGEQELRGSHCSKCSLEQEAEATDPPTKHAGCGGRFIPS